MKILILTLLIILTIAQQDQLLFDQAKPSYLSTISNLRRGAYQSRMQGQKENNVNVLNDQIRIVAEEVVVGDTKVPQSQTVLITSRVNSPTRVQHIVPAPPKNNGQQQILQSPVILQKPQLISNQQQPHIQQQVIIQKPQLKSQIVLQQKQFQPKQQQQRPNKQLRSVEQLAQIGIYGKPIILQPQPQENVLAVQTKPVLLQKQSIPFVGAYQQKTQQQNIIMQENNNNNNRPQFANEKQQPQKKQSNQQLIYGTQFPNLGQLKNWNVNKQFIAPAHSP